MNVVFVCLLPLFIVSSARSAALALIQMPLDVSPADLSLLVTPKWNGLSQEIQTTLIGAGVALLLKFVHSNRVQLGQAFKDGLVFLQGFSTVYAARVTMRVVRLLTCKSGSYLDSFCNLFSFSLIVVAFDPDPRMAKIRQDIRRGMPVHWQDFDQIRRGGHVGAMAAFTTLVLMLMGFYDGYRFMAYIMAFIDEFLCAHANRIGPSLSTGFGEKMLVRIVCPS